MLTVGRGSSSMTAAYHFTLHPYTAPFPLKSKHALSYLRVALHYFHEIRRYLDGGVDILQCLSPPPVDHLLRFSATVGQQWSIMRSFLACVLLHSSIIERISQWQ